MIDPTDLKILVSKFSEFDRVDTAESLGISIMGFGTENDAEIQVSEDDAGRVLRLAFDDAIKKFLPELDAKLAKLPKTAAPAAPAAVAPAAAPAAATPVRVDPPATPAAPAAPAPTPATPASAAPATPATPDAATASKFCPECGKPVAAGVKFCPHDGTPIK